MKQTSRFKFKNAAETQLMRSHSRSGDGAVTPPGPGLSRGVTAPLAPPDPPSPAVGVSGGSSPQLGDATGQPSSLPGALRNPGACGMGDHSKAPCTPRYLMNPFPGSVHPLLPGDSPLWLRAPPVTC